MKTRTEIPMKEWLVTKAIELGINPSALRMRISRGKYPMPTIRKINSRVLMVLDEK